MRGPKRIALLHATLIDGTGRKPVPDAMVLIEGKRILSAGKMTEGMTMPPNTKLIDCTGKYVMPGLIDCHIHYESPRDLPQFLAWGVTSVNCMFETQSQADSMAAMTADDSIHSPQIYATAPIFSTKGGWWYGDGFPTEPEINRFPISQKEAREQVDKIKTMGGERIKLMYDDMNWCRDPLPKLNRMDRNIMKALIGEAKKKKLFTEVHAPKLSDAKEMLDAGVDAFAHGIVDKPFAASDISKMKQRGVFYVPTFCVFEFLADTKAFMQNAISVKAFADAQPVEFLERYQSPEYLTHYKEAYPNISFVNSHTKVLEKNMAALHNAGVPVVMGTDMWTFQGCSAHLELEYMVKAGMSPSDAIVSATSSAAKFLHKERLGKLDIGMQADVLVLDADPTKDIKNTRKIFSIIKHGVMFDHAELVKEAREWKQ